MLIGLALFAAGVGGAVALQPSKFVEAVLLILAIAAWFVGACGMVGYMRWFFASEALRARQDAVTALNEKRSESRSEGL